MPLECERKCARQLLEPMQVIFSDPFFALLQLKDLNISPHLFIEFNGPSPCKQEISGLKNLKHV